MRLLKKHIEAMEQIRGGADVHGFMLAQTLREIQRGGALVNNSQGESRKHWVQHPEGALFEITDLAGKYNYRGVMPYFGAILLKAGEKVIKEYKKKQRARKKVRK